MSASWYLVVPSSKISGGIREAFRLGEDMTIQGCDVSVLSMWNSPHAVTPSLDVVQLSTWRPNPGRALVQLPLLFFRFLRWLRLAATNTTKSPARFIFTHYVTLPLSLLVPAEQRFFFVQDLEWKFVHNAFLSRLLRKTILYFYERGKLISANAYLTAALEKLGLSVLLEAPIWADAAFSADATAVRDIDFVMVLRKGAHKRLDLYLSFIELSNRQGQLKLAVISPEDEIIDAVRESVGVCLLRPSLVEMRALYMRSKCFVHLSDHEGFGLPPLEAMGAGCVPLCRDSGGVRAYMQSSTLASLLLPADMSIDAIFSRGQMLLASSNQLEALAYIARDTFHKGLAIAADRRATLSLVLA